MDTTGQHPVLSPSARAVLTALHRRAGVKLGVRDLARDTRRAPPTVRVALAALERARLVRHLVQHDDPDRPAYPVYWITGDGRRLAGSWQAGQ